MRNLTIVEWEFCISFWLYLWLEILSGAIHLQGGGTSRQRLHTSRGTDTAPLQCPGFRTQDSGLWIPSHRDLLAGMASLARIKEAALQRQHRSHHSCLRKTKVKAQIKSCVFWGLTQWWSSGYALAWWVGQWCPQQSRREGTGEGLGKRQRELIPFLAVLSFRLRIREEIADKSDKRKLSSKVHFTGIFRLSGKMSNTFACSSAILKVIINWKITVS